MKTKERRRNHIFIMLILILINFFCGITPVYPQEGDKPQTAWKWYHFTRSFPYDTIPSGAFENAVNQRITLWQSTGFQAPGTSWEQIGPLPLVGYGPVCSGRIAHVVYDPRDPNELGNYIYVTGASGGLWKTEDGGANWQNPIYETTPLDLLAVEDLPLEGRQAGPTSYQGVLVQPMLKL